MKKKHIKIIDYVRVLSCIIILCYHLNLLSGGYLAVCTFFVLSGYLSIVSSFNSESFSIRKYYINKIKKIYIPLIIVTFISIALILLFTDFHYINLKPEVTSILLGYNNYWQLNANLDYFVRSASSPFMHFWYIAILLQFDLVFPIIFKIYKKIEDFIPKFIFIFLVLLFSVLSYVYFCLTLKDGNIMTSYYDTFTRIFSILFGVALGLFHKYYHPLVISNRIFARIILFVYMAILIAMSFFVDSNISIIYIAMIISTFISMRLISYAVNIDSDKTTILDKIINYFSKISYEVYLVQYPILFILQLYNLNNYIYISLTIVLSFVISALLHFCLDIGKKKKLNVLRVLFLIPVILISIYGLYEFICSKDYTEDMKKLESDLAETDKLIEEKQKEYLANKKEEELKWQDFLNSEEKDEKDIEQMVRNLRIVGIGDSIMELAVKKLYGEFPNGYFDAATNRTEHSAVKIINELEKKGIVADAFLFNLGTNGECSEACRAEILRVVGDRKLFWVNATRPDFASFNPNLEAFASKHDNVYIVDWRSVGLAHPEYLIYDRVHPNPTGCGIYAKSLFDGVYNVYLQEYKESRAEKIKEHESYEKNSITFIGNKLLSSIYNMIDSNYINKKIIIENELNYEKINNLIKDNNISNNVVLVIDNSSEISKKEYMNIIKLCSDKKLYIIDINNNIDNDLNNVTIIDFEYDKYLEFDNIHLNEKGKEKLYKSIKKHVIEEQVN